MDKRTIQINDSYRKNLSEKVFATARSPRGEVTIYDKLKNGNLKLIEKNNLIVYQGREWLLQKSFETELLGYNSDNYSKYIRWFGLGTGGGEAGNPLQAGATRAWDSDLSNQIRINPVTGSYPSYSPKWSGSVREDGWYKKFSDVIRREDHANPYIIGSDTFYPELVAEIRIDISSSDGNGSDGTGYYDLNEAGLYVCSSGEPTQDGTAATTGGETFSVDEVITDGNDAKYVLELGAGPSGSYSIDIEQFNVGDYVTTQNFSNGTNNFTVPTIIKDIGYEEEQCRAYVIIDRATAVDEAYNSPGTITLTQRASISEIALFSRVTFSTIRKTSDREIVFLWKIYF